MIENKAVCGLVASAPLAIILALYALLRGQAVSALLTNTQTFASLTSTQATAIAVVGMAAAALLMGAAAGLVYGMVESRRIFPLVALAFAVALSFLAMLTHTSLLADKILGNFAVAFVLGSLIPLIAA